MVRAGGDVELLFIVIKQGAHNTLIPVFTTQEQQSDNSRRKSLPVKEF